jgi:acyl carrier protein
MSHSVITKRLDEEASAGLCRLDNLRYMTRRFSFFLRVAKRHERLSSSSWDVTNFEYRWRNAVTDSEILNLIKEALVEASPEHAGVTLKMESTLSEIGVSSITALEIAGFIEEKLNIRLPDDELAPLNTIGGLAQLIRQQI